MDEDIEQDLEVVELGEAKELTKGALVPPIAEDNPTMHYQRGG